MTAKFRKQTDLHFTGVDLPGSKDGDFGAHHRSIDEIEAQHRNAVVVAGDLKVRVQEAMREIRPTAVPKIHDGERNFAHDVDPAERIDEIDAVEYRQLPVEARNVAKVEIAVAFTHEALV